MAVYMTAVRIVAMSRPPHPPSASPNCQPLISPEMTYATPSPARSTQPAAPFCNWRCSMYSSPTFSYSTPCVLRLSSRSLIWTSVLRPYVPCAHQSCNDRDINTHRLSRQQSLGGIRHQISGILSYPKLFRFSKPIADACSLKPLGKG